MNFEPVGVDERGGYYLKYSRPFNRVEQIQLLQRWIMVQSFAYYELNENILEDCQYDANSYQLVEMLKKYPAEAKRSRYYPYFHDYTGETGYHLVGRVQKKDYDLYRHIWMDAVMALEMKKKGEET